MGLFLLGTIRTGTTVRFSENCMKNARMIMMCFNDTKTFMRHSKIRPTTSIWSVVSLSFMSVF